MDVDSNSATPMRYKVTGIPTLLVFKGGQVVEQLVGYQPEGRHRPGPEQAHRLSRSSQLLSKINARELSRALLFLRRIKDGQPVATEIAVEGKFRLYCIERGIARSESENYKLSTASTS